MTFREVHMQITSRTTIVGNPDVISGSALGAAEEWVDVAKRSSAKSNV
jgi:hypothetical protein